MFFFKKRKKVQTQQQPSEPAPESLCVTTVLTSEKTSILDIANLQGIGQREQQQDAFGISPADRYETDGILAVLCDGMGGMAEGQRIAIQTVSCLLNHFPFPEPYMHPEDLSAVLRTRRLHPCRCLDFGKSTALLERRRQRPFSAPGTSALCIKHPTGISKGPAAAFLSRCISHQGSFF